MYRKGLAVTTDCNSRYVFADPYVGTMIAVAEAARNIVCSGGEPLGVTNCLNFGNPYDPEVYYQFTEAIRGMGEACRKFDTPVTGGNVSFYNQSPDGPVYPTPTIGMVGLLDDMNYKMSLDFKNEGDAIYLTGKVVDDIGSSEYLHKIKGVEFSTVPYFNLDEEFRLHEILRKLVREKMILSAHDLSEGGLIISLLESAFPRALGFSVSHTVSDIRNDAFWFGEAQGRVVVSVSAEGKDDFEASVKSSGIPFMALGSVTTGNINVNNENWGSVRDWEKEYENALPSFLNNSKGENALSPI
ncbi:MAG: hypothetical protein EOO01_24985 [Chitinophagaceae bacterium]|nr:MAG: hypothetical protein EOO01_24985 [Chitinophagaceae bacterium]